LEGIDRSGVVSRGNAGGKELQSQKLVLIILGTRRQVDGNLLQIFARR
jgi:hypothetical protein